MLDCDLEPDYYPEPEPSAREQELEQLLDDAATLLKEVVTQLYTKDKLNEPLLDGVLGELGWLFKVEVPEGAPTVERKNNTLTAIAKAMGWAR